MGGERIENTASTKWAPVQTMRKNAATNRYRSIKDILVYLKRAV